MMELLTGGIMQEEEIVYESTLRLQKQGRWESTSRFQVEFLDDHLDSGQVIPLLRHTSEEWIRSVAPPQLITSDFHWLVVETDENTGQVVGLPERWRMRLEERVRAKARSLEPTRGPEYWGQQTRFHKDTADQLAPGTYQGEPIAFLTSPEEHRKHLEHALTVADKHIMIASSVLGPLDMELYEWIWGALGRNVDVDLLWGYTQPGPAHAAYPSTARYNELAEQARQDQGVSGWLRFNRRPTDSNANILLYGTGEQYTAVLGSYPWLNEVAPNTRHLSVVVQHDGIVAEICHSLAALAETGNNPLMIAPERWRNVALTIARRTTESPRSEVGPTEACKLDPSLPTLRLIRDQEHDALTAQCLALGQMRRGILSATLDDYARPLLARGRNERPLNSFYGSASRLRSRDEAALAELHAMAATPDLLRQVQGLGANLVVADNEALISSRSPLASLPPFFDSPPGEIGLFITDPRWVDQAWKYVETIQKETQQ